MMGGTFFFQSFVLSIELNKQTIVVGFEQKRRDFFEFCFLLFEIIYHCLSVKFLRKVSEKERKTVKHQTCEW